MLFRRGFRPRLTVAKTARRVRRRPDLGVERMEQRIALTVAAPTIDLTPQTDSGVRGDRLTRFAAPAFTGVAPVGTRVFVANGETVIGSALTNGRGVWTLQTPGARAFFGGGVLSLTATAVNAGGELSAATNYSLTIDRTPPQATALSFDGKNGSVTATFSERVTGMSTARIQLAEARSRLVLALNSPTIRSVCGVITVTQPTPNSYRFTPEVNAFAPGTYSLALLKTGIFDLAGNPLPVGIRTSFTQSAPIT
ncbi:MAG: Ig-like domain-containing protein [Planctomycetia bacterium]